MQTTDDHAETIVLRESIRARVTVAPVSMLATFLAIAMFIPFLVSQGVTYTRIGLWTVPILVLILGRGYFSGRLRKRLDGLSNEKLAKADMALRISSIANQVAVGLGIWIVQSPSAAPFVLPLFMTLIAVIWSVGVMSNLFSDFPSFILSISVLIGSVAGFWLMQADIGISIGMSMLLAMSLMMLLVRQGSKIFRDSVLMRFEKDQLLEQLEIEQRNTERALLEAQTANDAKTFFMAAASHDIKQPLYALGILTDTLMMSEPPQAIATILQTQRNSINQMSDHFDALMDMDKFKGGSFALTVSTFRLGVFSKRISDEFAQLCQDRGLAWHISMDDVLVSTDAELLLRLFRNLLVNAVRYTEHGEVRCSASVTGEQVEFLISDTGIGIAAEHQEAVFAQFVRLDNHDTQSIGKGLGLSIVDKIDRALELGLQMSSTLGKGTEFTFRLPLVREAQQGFSR